MARIDEVLQETAEVPEPENGIDLSSQPEPGDIRFEGVCFRYRAQDSSSTLDEALTEVEKDLGMG